MNETLASDELSNDEIFALLRESYRWTYWGRNFSHPRSNMVILPQENVPPGKRQPHLRAIQLFSRLELDLEELFRIYPMEDPSTMEDARVLEHERDAVSSNYHGLFLRSTGIGITESWLRLARLCGKPITLIRGIPPEGAFRGMVIAEFFPDLRIEVDDDYEAHVRYAGNWDVYQAEIAETISRLRAEES